MKDLNVNNVTTLPKVIVGSMDIDKWYPSTIPAPSAKEVGEMYVNSNVEIETITYDKVSKYLGEHLTEKEIKDEGMEEIVYIKVKKTKNKISKKKGNKIIVEEMINIGAHDKEHGINNVISGDENQKKADKSVHNSMTRMNTGAHDKEHDINNISSENEAEKPKDAQQEVGGDIPNVTSACDDTKRKAAHKVMDSNRMTKTNVGAHAKDHGINNITSAVEADKLKEAQLEVNMSMKNKENKVQDNISNVTLVNDEKKNKVKLIKHLKKSIWLQKESQQLKKKEEWSGKHWK